QKHGDRARERVRNLRCDARYRGSRFVQRHAQDEVPVPRAATHPISPDEIAWLSNSTADETITCRTQPCTWEQSMIRRIARALLEKRGVRLKTNESAPPASRATLPTHRPNRSHSLSARARASSGR